MKNYTDAEFQHSMTGAVRLGSALAAAGAIAFAITRGWQSALMFLVGSLISITGVWEWRRLMTAVALQMDVVEPETSTNASASTTSTNTSALNISVEESGRDGLQPVHSAEIEEGALAPDEHLAKKPKMGIVLGVFFLRLGLTVVVLYVTLKYLRGSALALAAGLMVGIIALTAQAVRLLRSWSA